MRIQRFWGKAVLKPKLHATSLTNSYTAPPLHLFRALLRECTYLPDPDARKFLHKYVVARFRANWTRPSINIEKCSKRTKAILERRPELLKKAQTGLKYLCRANHGHYEHLSKILALTYGRIGPRRHDLIHQLGPRDSGISIDASVSAGNPRDIQQWRSELANQHVPLPSQRLLALLRSQAKCKEEHFPVRPLQKLQPEIPKANSWGRPIPIKRARNIKKKWYAKALSRVMPPLPEAEWETLRKKAAGEVFLSQPVRRRGASREGNIGLETYISQNHFARPHTLNSRYMRRLWTKTFRQCPVMKTDPGRSSGWSVTWPNPEVQVGIGLNSGSTNQNPGFIGVDDDGKIRAINGR